MKRLTITLLVCLMTLASLCISCSKNEPEEKVTYTDMPTITVINSQDLIGFVGDKVTLRYTITGDGKTKIQVNPTCDNSGKITDHKYDTSAGSGYITIELKEEAYVQKNCAVCIQLKLGTRSTYYNFSIKVYYIHLECDDILLPLGEKDERKEIDCKVYTNLEDYSLAFKSDSDWLRFEGNSVVTTSENRREETRQALVTAFDAKTGLVAATFTVAQYTMGPEPVEGCVEFKDWNFKKACVEVADTNGDGEVSLEEAEAVQELVVRNKGIKNIKGIECFKNVWKFDAYWNDIEDASAITNLSYLHSLNLDRNPHLKTFDIRGCSMYFDECNYTVTDDLLYHTLCKQMGVSGFLSPDYYCEHSKHEIDRRETTDWSRHGRLVKIASRTRDAYDDQNEKQNRAICFSGIGYLDVDMENGTFERAMRDAYENFIQNFNITGDTFDAYILEYCSPNRYYYTTDYKEEKVDERNQELKDIAWMMYSQIFGDVQDENNFLFAATINLEGQPDAEGHAYVMYLPITQTFGYNQRYIPLTCDIHQHMDDMDRKGGEVTESNYINVTTPKYEFNFKEKE